MAAGNTINRYKQWLNLLEEQSPGTKANFLYGFLDRGRSAFLGLHDHPELGACAECGQPTTGEVCAFCRLRRQTLVRIEPRVDT